MTRLLQKERQRVAAQQRWKNVKSFNLCVLRLGGGWCWEASVCCEQGTMLRKPQERGLQHHLGEAANKVFNIWDTESHFQRWISFWKVNCIGKEERWQMIIYTNAIQNFHLSEDLPMNNSLRQGPTVQNNEWIFKPHSTHIYVDQCWKDIQIIVLTCFLPLLD